MPHLVCDHLRLACIRGGVSNGVRESEGDSKGAFVFFFWLRPMGWLQRAGWVHSVTDLGSGGLGMGIS